MTASNKVVVTGMGIVAPNGIGLDAFWDSLIHCKSGVGPITLFDTSDIPLKIAGEVSGFNLRDHINGRCKPSRLARQTQLGIVACKMAIENAGLSKKILQENAPVSMVLGISSNPVDITQEVTEILLTHGASRVRPSMAGACQPFSIGAALVDFLDIRMSVTTISAACPSGLDAVAVATKKIKEGGVDVVIVGTADSPLNISTVAAFIKAGIPSLSTDFPPEEISRPFDAKRSGVVLSEGAGFLVLERLDSALSRGAEPLMEILGGATVTDTPGSGGMEGLFHSMNMAIKNAGIYPEQVDYICANATSDPLADKTETQLIKKIFGARAYQLPISSIRGVTGHSLAPAGMSQVIACALTMKHQTLLPTANLTNPDPECDLDYVPLKSRKAGINVALANSHGLGGENSTVVMKTVR